MIFACVSQAFCIPQEKFGSKTICRSCRFKCVEVIPSTSINNAKAESQGYNDTPPDQRHVICTDKELSDSCTVLQNSIDAVTGSSPENNSSEPDAMSVPGDAPDDNDEQDDSEQCVTFKKFNNNIDQIVIIAGFYNICILIYNNYCLISV